MSRIFLVLWAAFLGVSCSGSMEREPAVTLAEAPLAGVDLVAYLDCARERGVTLIQAHRAGDRPGAAENSLAAINASLADGAIFLEIDVARAADGTLILMHDDTLDRTTTGSGAVANTRYEDMAALTLLDTEGSDTGEPVPTLVDALRALEGRGIAQLDRKRPTTFDEIARVLESEEAVGRSILIAYTMDEAIEIHQRLPDALISVGIASLDDVELLRAAGIDPARVVAWLGLGSGNPALDVQLSALGMETSYGDFRAEADGTVNYQLMAENGAEVISVDHVSTAGSVLDAPPTVSTLLRECE